MAEADFTRNIEQPIQTEFKPFSWLCDDVRDDFLETTYNITNGATLALEIVNDAMLREADKSDQVFKPNDQSSILFLATSALKLLSDAAFQRIDALNDKSLKHTSKQ